MFGLTTADLPARNPRKGMPPKTVHLIHPHTSELPTTAPFGKVLEERLTGAGIKTAVHATTDLMERGWALKKSLAAEFSEMDGRDFRMLLDGVLSTSDIFGRLKLLNALSADPGAFCLELHSYIHPGCSFFLGRTAWRLDGTGLVSDTTFPKVMTLGMLHEMGRSLRNLGHGVADRAFRAVGLDFGSLEATLRGLYAGLKEAKPRLAFIEIPADHAPLGRDHPMYSEYYDAEGRPVNEAMSYEWGYLTCHHMPRGGPSETDIRQVMAMLRLRE